MQIGVTLYGTLRELLPKEARGKTALELPEGSALAVVRERLNLPDVAVLAVNNRVERDERRALQEGDRVSVFRPAGGG